MEIIVTLYRQFPKGGWIMILRLYDPMESWFDKRLRPGEMEKVI
jgi:hypothetical protein